MDTVDKTFRWGVIGCGMIAPRFTRALKETGAGSVVAAASTSGRRARHFRETTGVQRVYTSYEEMLKNEQLDAVYIATTHNFHAEHARLCLEHRLPVLVEKPFTQNAAQAKAVIELARARGLFMMEAMWTRFNPASRRLCDLLREGVIGEPRLLEADFRVRMNPFSTKTLPWNRMYSPRLAGGALLDIGIYPIAFAHMVFGQPPSHIVGSAEMTWTGVDKTSRWDFEYSNGARAGMEVSFVKQGSREVVIHGAKGRIRIPAFYRADRLIVEMDGQPAETIRCDEPSFTYQIREVHRCLREGLSESPLMPLNESLENIRTLDAIRAQWGMRYPDERAL